MTEARQRRQRSRWIGVQAQTRASVMRGRWATPVVGAPCAPPCPDLSRQTGRGGAPPALAGSGAEGGGVAAPLDRGRRGAQQKTSARPAGKKTPGTRHRLQRALRPRRPSSRLRPMEGPLLLAFGGQRAGGRGASHSAGRRQAARRHSPEMGRRSSVKQAVWHPLAEYRGAPPPARHDAECRPADGGGGEGGDGGARPLGGGSEESGNGKRRPVWCEASQNARREGEARPSLHRRVCETFVATNCTFCGLWVKNR